MLPHILNILTMMRYHSEVIMNIQFQYKLTGESVMRHSHKKHTCADKVTLIVSLIALVFLLVK